MQITPVEIKKKEKDEMLDEQFETQGKFTHSK